MTAVPELETVYGSTLPRVYTSPLVTGSPGPCGCGCALDYTTSYGFHVADFADEILHMPLDPWQRWLVIHAGEMLPDGRPRFRKVLVLISRQNGKTFVGVVLTLYWIFLERQKLVLGTSTNRDTAKESWQAAAAAAQDAPELAAEMPAKGAVRKANGSETLETVAGCRYQIAASNGRGGRGRTINRLILDELREHHTFEAVAAAVPATSAVRDAQIWAFTNQGGDDSIVLHSWRRDAMTWIDSGEGDRRLGIFEWSAPEGADPLDIQALAQANPSLGSPRGDIEELLGEATTAKAAGGAELADFRTERMCQRVNLLDPAIDPDRWTDCASFSPPNLADHRERVALCLDVALDGDHASLVAAALLDGKVHLEVIAVWSDMQLMRHQVAELVAKVRPAVFGWMPMGPAAAMTAELAEKRGVTRWPPHRVKLEEIRAEIPAVCMGLADLVRSGQVGHPRDELLTAHVGQAQRARRGDAWVFGRRDSGGPIDAVYAAAGAAHLARLIKVRPPLTAL